MKAITYLVSAVVAWIAVLPQPALCEEEPTVSVRSTVDAVREVVKTEKNTLGEEEIDKKLREIISPVFNFEEMSKRCLGQNWNKANQEQRTEFVDLFSELLARTYLKKIRDNVEKSAINYLGQNLTGNVGVVKTSVSGDGESATIDYRLRKEGDKWRIYDVVIERIGLVSNYRSEFAGIVRKDGIAGLLEKLRDKVNKEPE